DDETTIDETVDDETAGDELEDDAEPSEPEQVADETTADTATVKGTTKPDHDDTTSVQDSVPNGTERVTADGAAPDD
ncbi:MAG: hypothetical protein ABEI77_00450, partial [Halorientalis sp.]